jgi:hypothetical protein
MKWLWHFTSFFWPRKGIKQDKLRAIYTKMCVSLASRTLTSTVGLADRASPPSQGRLVKCGRELLCLGTATSTASYHRRDRCSGPDPI